MIYKEKSYRYYEIITTVMKDNHNKYVWFDNNDNGINTW